MTDQRRVLRAWDGSPGMSFDVPPPPRSANLPAETWHVSEPFREPTLNRTAVEFSGPNGETFRIWGEK